MRVTIGRSNASVFSCVNLVLRKALAGDLNFIVTGVILFLYVNATGSTGIALCGKRVVL